MGRFDQAGFTAFARSAEGAFLVAEQLTFQQRFGKGRAIDRHERAALAVADIVHALGQQLLAGTAFTGDQHRR
ncbi:hypothetical protein D3C76_908050 [compost metagenome]